MNAQNGCKNESTTFVEGGLSGVLHFSRADDRKNAPIVAKIRVSRKFKLSFILKKYSFKTRIITEQGARKGCCKKTLWSFSEQNSSMTERKSEKVQPQLWAEAAKLWVRTHSSSLLRTPMTPGLFAVCAAVPH